MLTTICLARIFHAPPWKRGRQCPLSARLSRYRILMGERTMPKPNCSEEIDVGTIEFGRPGRLDRRVVESRFDVGSMTSDGGVMLPGAKPAPKPGRFPSWPGDGRRCGAARVDSRHTRSLHMALELLGGNARCFFPARSARALTCRKRRRASCPYAAQSAPLGCATGSPAMSRRAAPKPVLSPVEGASTAVRSTVD